MAGDCRELPTEVACHLAAVLLKLSTKQVAEALGVHRTTVKAALLRATAAHKAQAKQWLELLERAHPEEPWWKK